MSVLPLFMEHVVSEPKTWGGRQAGPLRLGSPRSAPSCPHSEPPELPVGGCSGGSAPPAHPLWLLTADTLSYKPTLASSSLGGLITTSTFTLEQPRCVFSEDPSNPVIWLVVTTPKGRWGAVGSSPGQGCAQGSPSSPQGSILTPVPIPAAVPIFNDSIEPGSPERAFQGFPSSAPAYMTLNTTLLNYPCTKRPGDITVLRVGSETNCAEDETRPTCNGPLPGPGPYR